MPVGSYADPSRHRPPGLVAVAFLERLVAFVHEVGRVVVQSPQEALFRSRTLRSGGYFLTNPD